MAEAQFNTISDWKSRGFHMRTPPLIIVSYDPAGDGDDRDALVMQAREEHQKGETWDPDFAVQIMFRVLMVHQMSNTFEFPDKIAMLLRLHRQLNAWQRVGRCKRHVICVETNGVGYAMGSTLRSTIGNHVLTYHTVSAAANDRPYADKRISMPRLPALDNLRVLAETQCLKIARDAPGKKVLEQEMASFVWRRPGRPEAIDGQRDDTVMATAGGCWIGTRVLPTFLKQTRVTARGIH